MAKYTCPTPDLAHRSREVQNSLISPGWDFCGSQGITVSERTVSRYLPDRTTGQSQTWRTFLVNHFGVLLFTSSVASLKARGDDGLADASGRPLCSTLPSDVAPCASDPWAAVTDWSPSAPRTCRDWQDNRIDLHHPASTRPSSGRGPPASRYATGSNADRRKFRPLDTFDRPQANGRGLPEVGGMRHWYARRAA